MANNVAILTTKPGYVPFSGETVVIDRFDSKEDVISAVLASYGNLTSFGGHSSRILGSKPPHAIRWRGPFYQMGHSK